MTRQRVADGLLVASMVLGVISGWLTWTISGSAERNSYASLRAAQRRGIEELTPFRVVWFCLPVVALGLVVLLLAEWRRPALISAAVVGVVLIGFGSAVLLTPVASGVGPWLSCVSGASAVIVSIWSFAQGVGRS